MEIPEFLVGSEKKFSEFVSKLGEKDKIALISHTDLDGFASAKVVDKVVEADFRFFVDYDEINDTLLSKLKKLKVNKIVMTDLSIDEPEFLKKVEKFAEILIIDHHQFTQDFNTERITFLAAYEYCAAYLCYYLFSKVKNLEDMDWLVACAARADFMFSKNRKWTEGVVKKYGDKMGDYASGYLGKINYVKDRIGYGIVYWKTKDKIDKVYDLIPGGFEVSPELEKCASEVDEEIQKSLTKFEEEKKRVNCRLVWIFSPKFRIGSIVSTLISLRHQNQTVLILRPRGDKYGVSARRQDREENMNELLKKVVGGLKGASAGGHIPAAGGYFAKKDLKEIMARLEKI